MKNSTIYSIKGKSNFLVSPSKTGKTGLVLNTITGKSYKVSLKNVKLTIVRRKKIMFTPAVTVLNTEKKNTTVSMKHRIKTMFSKITISVKKYDRTLKL